MANERYKIIKLMEHKEWLKDAPIKVDKSQLLFDTQKNTTLLQIKMFNLSLKSIKSVFLDVACYDNENKNVESLTDVAYLMIEAEPQAAFGDKSPILLKSLQVESVDITISKVIFADSSEWNNSDKEKGVLLEEQKVIDHNDTLYQQINREFIGIDIKPYYWFENSKDYWRCTCGQTNSHTAAKCGYCGIERLWIEKHLNKEYLFEENEKYQEAVLLQKRQEEALIVEKSKRRKKYIKRAMMLVGFFPIAIGVSVGYDKILSPMITYNKAISLYNNKDYEEAVEAFTNMQGYKNSKDMITKSLYQDGIKLLESGDYENALNKFKQVETYGKAKNYIMECHYNIGNDLLNNNKWEAAFTKFQEIDMKEIPKELNAPLSESYYQCGLYYASEQMWDKAVYSMSQAIWNGEYKDAKSLIDIYNNNIRDNELLAQYNEAIKFEEYGRLDLAYNIYKTLSANYKDCDERMNRISSYIDLCGKYEEEIEYSAKTMKEIVSQAYLTKAEVTIKFDNNIPIINISVDRGDGSIENYKDKFENMPIEKEYSFGSTSSKNVIRFSDGILYSDFYVYTHLPVSTILKFKKL